MSLVSWSRRAGVRGAVVLVMLAAGATPASAVDVEVVNSSGRPSSSIY